MATIDAATGKLLDGISEVWQSINTIMSTALRTRIERRTFGADRVSFVDRSVSPLNLIDFYAQIAKAIKAEPRFRLTTVSLSQDSQIAAGRTVFNLVGVYYPRGHLGDFSVAITAKGQLVWSDPVDNS